VNVVVTGAAGQLGTDMVLHLRAAGDEVTGVDRDALDITDNAAVSRLVATARPDVVINCAAFTAVDRCETEIETAHAVNEHGVRFLAQACAAANAHLVHVSTDYVFDGRLDRPYREDDSTNPQSVYGRSKLAGEHAALDTLGAGVTIARTSWVCGEHGNNMVKLVRRLAAENSPMSFVDDQRGCPSFTADLAPALRVLAAERPGDIVHVTNSGAVTWYEFVREILAASGDDPDRVRSISTDELDPPRPAPRPANSVLDNARWCSLGHDPLRDFRDPLAELVARL
jgi:dTDP-4-dehydrorhamnose reductase